MNPPLFQRAVAHVTASLRRATGPSPAGSRIADMAGVTVDSRSGVLEIAAEADPGSLLPALLDELRNLPPRVFVELSTLELDRPDACLARYLRTCRLRGGEPESTCWTVHGPGTGTGENRDPVESLVDDFAAGAFCPALSELDPIVLARSAPTGRVRVLSGRRRVVALRFLAGSRGIHEDRALRVHLLEHHREHLEDLPPCGAENFGTRLDPGPGTHQDFYMLDGLPRMRGRPDRKGGRQKWELIRPVWTAAFSGRRVLDVGAYRGLFCLLSFGVGARDATALENSSPLMEVAASIRDRYDLEDFAVISGDFQDATVYEGLCREGYDTVLFFGVIHHLLRQSIRNGILHDYRSLFERIGRLARHGVLVEYAPIREESFEEPFLAEHRAAFTREAFEEGLRASFPRMENLGLCPYQHHRSMYWAQRAPDPPPEGSGCGSDRGWIQPFPDQVP